jgi:arsenate reductase (glutaredoxin)
MSDVTIYHNPNCGTSRATLELIRKAGIEPTVVEYLKTPPDRATVQDILARMHAGLRTILREKGTPYAELGLGDATLTEEALLDALIAHPVLLNRPIVVTARGAKLCRPAELVLDLLP